MESLRPRAPDSKLWGPGRRGRSVGVALDVVEPHAFGRQQLLQGAGDLVGIVQEAEANDAFGWYWILLGIASFFILLRLLKRNEAGRFIVDAIKLKIPVVGQLIEKICLSRFAHHLGVLLRTGVDITQSLSITERVVGNAVLAQAVREAREKVIDGGSLWRSLQETGVFPPLLVRMVFVGESSGTLDVTLEKVTQFYDREIPATVKKVFAVLEPLIIVTLAGMVLIIALAIFIPLYGALGKVGGR